MVNQLLEKESKVLLQVSQITQIVKRDGRCLSFDQNKIAGAILKAFRATNENFSIQYALTLTKRVEEKLLQENVIIPTVEQVQDTIEQVLMNSNHSVTAKAFILYREERSRVREMNNRLMKTYEDITFSDAKESDVKRENANVDGDTAMGTMLKYGSEGAKHFNNLYVLKPEHAKAHQNGDIHIHDLDFLTLTTTCCQIDLVKLFNNGFSTGHGTLREPNDISSYASLACIAIQSNQNDQHGGQSIPNFDYALALGVRKTFIRKYRENYSKALEMMNDEVVSIDEVKRIQLAILNDGGELRLGMTAEYCLQEAGHWMNKGFSKVMIDKCQQFAVKQAESETDRATYQAMEAFIHNLNTMHSRAGAQTPFSSINYGTDTSSEGRLVIKNILLALEAGLGDGETPIFPIQIFRVKEGINFEPEDCNYDLFKLACRVSAKRLFPNFSFLDAPFNKKYYQEGRPETEVSYMGCRTRVMGNVHDPSNEITYGRGNLSFTSINLPRLALNAKRDVDGFFKELDHMINLCTEQLVERFTIQAKRKVRNSPFLMGQGIWLGSEKLEPDDEVGEVLKHGTLTIGFIGLAEALKALTGKHHGESDEAQELGLRIVQYMRNRMDEASAQTKLNFSLIATPAEGLSGRFVKMDKKIYGEIAGITDRDYYTNSFHVPVYYSLPAYKKISLEAPYHEMTNAGHITYVELDGDPARNVDAFEKIIRYMHKMGIGYGSINHPIDRDSACGYNGIIHDECPKCGRKETTDFPFERIRRITGYLVGTLDRFNNAKRAEVDDRVKHL